METNFIASKIPDLPLPLAQLVKRTLNAKNATDRHHNAYFLGEAALKLAAAARIGVWLEHAYDAQSPLISALEKLVRPSAGTWLELLRELDEGLAGHVRATELPLGQLLGMAARKPQPAPELGALVQAARDEGIINENAGKFRGLIGFFTVLVAYRNRVIGHGAQRQNSFYERFAGLLLKAAIEAVTSPAFLGDFQLTVVQIQEKGDRTWLSLTGLGSLPLAQDMVPPPPPAVAAGELFLSSKTRLIRLHPLVVFTSEDEQDRVGFLNETVMRGSGGIEPRDVTRVEYLDFATGAAFRVDDARISLGRFLGRLRGKDHLTEEELAALEKEEPEPEEVLDTGPNSRRFSTSIFLRQHRLGTALGAGVALLLVLAGFFLLRGWRTGGTTPTNATRTSHEVTRTTPEVAHLPPPAADPNAPATLDPRLRIAILPPDCGPIRSTLVDELRESALSNLSGVLIGADRIAEALAASTGPISESTLGRKLGAALVVASRCTGDKLKVRVILVASDAVTITEELTPTPTVEQVQVLVSNLQAERTLLLARTETGSDEAFRLFKQALMSLRSGFNPTNTDLAAVALRQSIKADATWPRPRLLLSEALLNKFEGAFDASLLQEVERTLEPLIEKPGWHLPETLTNLALMHIWREEFEEARNLMLRAQTLEMSDELKRINLELFYSLLLWLEGDFEGAISQSELGARRGHGISLFNVAIFRFQMGQLDRALADIEKAVEIQDRQFRLGDRDPELRRGLPAIVGAHAMKGFMLLANKRPAEALVSFAAEKKSLDQKPTYYNTVVAFWVHLGVADALRVQGQGAKSKQSMEQAGRSLEGLLKDSKSPNFQIFNYLGGVLPWIPDPLLDTALAHLRPELPFAQYADLIRAAGLHRGGKKDQAQTQLRALLSRAKPQQQKALEKNARLLFDYVERMAQPGPG